MYAQFALVIAATAMLSAINAVTLKPTQAALWLRPPVPPERRNAFYRGFNAVYGRMEHHYAGLIGRMASHAGLMTIVAFVIMGVGLFRPVPGADRLPAARGPGLSPRRRAAARRRRARAHAKGARTGLGDREKGSERRKRDRHLRRLSARQQCDLGQCRRRLCGAQGLERARRSAHAVPAHLGGARRRSTRG